MKKRITISELKYLIKHEFQKFQTTTLLESENTKDNSNKAMKQIDSESFKDFDIEALIDRERKRRFNDPKYKQDYDSAESDYADEMFHASFNDSIADEEEKQRSLENDVLYDMGIDPINENVNKQKLRNLIRESLFKLLK